MLHPPSMIIHDLDIPGVAVAELESDPPRPAGRYRPLSAPRAAQPMKTDRLQSGQVGEPFRLIEQAEPAAGEGFVEAGKPAFSFLGKTLGGPIGPCPDHDRL
ncbi:MAG TPA: hypothetical protein VM755_03970 [Stellaceae bacterium]|nr:hypothetical protein [Stellaceae bacterium]